MDGGHRARGYVGAAAVVVRAASLMGVVTAGVENPDLVADFPNVVSNRCSDFDLSGFADAMTCGPPLGAPCFDFNRCRNGTTIYVYDSECSLADSSVLPTASKQSHQYDKIVPYGRVMETPENEKIFRSEAKNAGLLAESYEDACLFIHVDGTPYNKTLPPCATTAPLWNGGRNHLMFDVFDPTRNFRPSYSGSYAMEASVTQYSCYYRSGYDLAVGLCPRVVFHELQSVPAEDRPYFLTFKGSLYLERMHGGEERRSIMGLHNDTDRVVVVEKCDVYVRDHYPQYAGRCAKLLPKYASYQYGALMNSTFGLVPAGGSPATYRLAEVMSAGGIPVMIARDYVKPFSEKLDWSTFSFTFSPDEVPDLVQTLRSVPPEEIRKMQQQSIHNYWKYFRGKDCMWTRVHHILNTVVRRIRHRES